MLFSRTTALVAMGLLVAGTSSASATVDRQVRSAINPRRVKSFKFCSRPVLDSMSFQPLTRLDGDSSLDNITIPYLFFPYNGVPDNLNDLYLYGALGNIMAADFGFKSNMNDCDSASNGDFNSTSLGTMVGTCKSIFSPFNATELFMSLENGRRRLMEANDVDQVRRNLQEEFFAYFETELYCTWKAIFNEPERKAGEKTVLTGTSIRTAVETGEDFVDGRSGFLSGNKPLVVSSVVKNLELFRRDRMLDEDPFVTAYTEYTVEYYRAKGWNPFYLSSK
ncbi:Hypothetical protein NocV09_01000640 [Nannochloropsis oceanica]